MKRLIFISFLFLYSLVNGQNVVVLSLFDSQTNEPIRNAVVKTKKGDSLLKSTSGSNGKVFFNGLSGKTFFTISHFKYIEKKIMKKIVNSEDTLFFSVKLEYIREQRIEEMVVTAPGIPQVVYGSNRVHVSDFEILKNGRLILLAYPKQLKKGSELLIYDGEKVIGQFEIEQKAKELVHDYRGNTYVICENEVIAVVVDEKSFGWSSLDKDYFESYIYPIIDTNDTKLYFSNYLEKYPEFDYLYYDQSDSIYVKFVHIIDELMMELYRSEIKWVGGKTRVWAKNQERLTGIDAEVIIGASCFTNSIYYKALYAPLFHRNDTIFVFDYYKDQLKYFDKNGEPLDSIPIYHHYNKRKTGWKSNLLQDRVTGQIYGVFERAGYSYIGYVDTKTGEINEQVKLKNRYAQEIQINGNYVYYIYRPYESAQKKFLYKERLPYDFGGAEVLKEEVELEQKN